MRSTITLVLHELTLLLPVKNNQRIDSEIEGISETDLRTCEKSFGSFENENTSEHERMSFPEPIYGYNTSQKKRRPSTPSTKSVVGE